MAKRGKVAVFVDRDGTIDFDKHYLADPNELELIPTVAEGIRKLSNAKLPVIVVTNQSGVARGYFSEKTLTEIHERLVEMLDLQGAKIEDVFHCPHMPNAGCPCRKPAPGMLLDAKKKHGIDLVSSFVIGDRMMDIEMAHAVGAKGVLVPEPGDQYHIDDEIRASKEKPDHRTETFSSAVDWVLEQIKKRRARSS